MTLEAGLQKLERQEVKYAAELDAALKEYAELQPQVTGLDFADLTGARLSIRPEKELAVQHHILSAYGDKYDPLMLLDSKRDVARLLHEDSEVKSVRAHLRQTLQEPQHYNHKSKGYER